MENQGIWQMEIYDESWCGNNNKNLKKFFAACKRNNIVVPDNVDSVLGGMCYLGNGVHIPSTGFIRNSTLHANVRVDSNPSIDRAMVCPNTTIGGSVHVGEGTIIGANCKIFPYAFIGGRTSIGDDVVVGDRALIFDGTRIGAGARIYVGVEIPANADIGNNAVIKRSEDIFTIGNLGSANRTLTVYRSKGKMYFSTGCFCGTRREFEKAIKNTHGNNVHGKNYLAAIEYAKARFAIKE